MTCLIIQTAFIGDVVLATALIEGLKDQFPDWEVDFLLRKGNEGLLEQHPKLRQVLIYDKKKKKYNNLFRLIRQIRKERYDVVINVQRFFTTGLITAFSGGKQTIGFKKNPLSFLFSHAIPHHINPDAPYIHEVDRNLNLLTPLGKSLSAKPALYPSEKHFQDTSSPQPYICIAPASVWFTKQWPASKWTALLGLFPSNHQIFLLGGPGDYDLCKAIMEAAGRDQVHNLAGQLSFLESAALIKNAVMTYTNDSAPMHFASAVNAPVTAIFCSTIPGFGFGPLSDRSTILETTEQITCRPCGLHGKKSCPEGHFKCAEIDVAQAAEALSPKEKLP